MKWDKAGWVDLQNPVYDRTKLRQTDSSDLQIIEGFLARELQNPLETRIRSQKVMLNGDKRTVRRETAPARGTKKKSSTKNRTTKRRFQLIQGGEQKTASASTSSSPSTKANQDKPTR